MPRGKQALHSGPCLAHHPPVPQEGVPAEVCSRPSSVFVVAVRGKETLCSERAQLHGDLEPHPHS